MKHTIPCCLLTLLLALPVLANGMAGEGYTIERIEVRGNEKTKTDVILKAMTLHQGDRLHTEGANSSKDALYATRLFRTVHLASKPGTLPDHAIVVVYVDEKRFGDLGVSLEYTELDGFGVSADAFHVNLLGEGKVVGAEWGLGERFKKWGFNYADPYFTSSTLLLSVKTVGSSADRDLFRSKQKQVRGRYDLERVGGVIGLGRVLKEGHRLLFQYSLDGIEVGAFQAPTVSTNGGVYADEVRAAVGRETQAYLGVDFQFRPSTQPWGSAPGTDFRLRVDLSAKYLGSSATFLRTRAEAAHHVSTFGRQILTVGARGGVILGTPPFYERFYLEGGNQLRGHEPRKIGPEGGEEFVTAEVVYSFPFLPYARFYGFGEVAALRRDLPVGSRSQRDGSVGVGVVLFKRVDISFGISTGTLIVKSHRFGGINVGL